MERSEISWDQFYDQLPQGIFEIDLQGNLLNANQFLLDVMGYTRDEMKKGLNVLNFVTPAERPIVIENMKKLHLGQKSLGNEYTLITKSGRKFPAVFYNSPIYDKNQKISGIAGFLIDITDKKQLREELIQERDKYQKLLTEFKENQSLFTDLLESQLVGLITIHNDKIVYANQKFAEIMGRSIEQIKFLTISDLFDQLYPEDKEILRESFRSYYNGRKTFKPMESTYRIIKPTQEIVWVVSAAYFFDLNSSPAAHIIFIEITHQKELEHQRDEERIRTQRLESLGLLAGGIAHDFNNILMGIMGNLQLMKLEETCNSIFQDYIVELEKMIKNATGLTSQLLTFSKGGEPMRKPENIIEIIENACSLTLRGRKTTYQLEYELSIPNVYVDKAQIIQVFNNLIINADQAMNFGGLIKIYVELAKSDEQHIVKEYWKYVKISVTDYGKGIPEELQDKIFSPYFTTKERGHGLGLATVYSIIKRHNGFITFKSKSGVGTTFYLYLPISDVVERQKIEIKNDVPKFITGRVLVLEDELPVLKVLERMLIKLGLEVETGSEGQEIVQKYIKAYQEGNPFDLLIMDLTIPNGMGGKEALDHLLDFDPNVKAIVSSGYSVDLPQYQKYGFQGMLTKPYSLEDLKSVIIPFLNKKTN
jgi:PAS domain S-box-containing protein